MVLAASVLQWGLVQVQDVNRLLKQFEEARKMMKRMQGLRGGKGGFPGMPKLPFM